MTSKGKVVKVDVKEGEDPALFLKNYINYCRATNRVPYSSVVSTLQNQQLYPIKQLIITSNLPTTNKSLENKTSTKDELSNIEKSIPNPSIPIEASNDSFVALMTALLGSDSTMRGGPYRLLQQLRVWQTPLSKNSLTSLVEVIRNGGEEVQLLSLELLNCGLEPIDVSSLGGSLSRGFNTSLTQLKLDFNINLGSEGCVLLCQGLRSNSTLKHLSLSYCSIGHTDDLKSSSSSGSTQNNSETGCHTQQLLRCGQALGDLLGNVKSSLEILNLSGNRVNGRILHLLCVRGLQPNNILKQLDLSDNEIDGKMAEDIEGLIALTNSLLHTSSGVTSLNLLYNHIGESGGLTLLPLREDPSTKVTELLVDTSIPLSIFEKLLLKKVPKKAKKGGGKAKKGK